MEKTSNTISEYFGSFDRESLKKKISNYYEEKCLEKSEITLETKDIFKDMNDWMLTFLTVDKLSGDEEICSLSEGDNTEMPIAAIIPSNDPTISVGLRLRYKS